MNKYEIMFIVKPDLEEANIKSVLDSMKSVIESKNAKILEVKEMGQRELAYEINNDATVEFDRVALINENIIRHLIVKVDE